MKKQTILTENYKKFFGLNLYESAGTESYNKLLNLLRQATQQAELVGRDVKIDKGAFKGHEGNDISGLLMQIWNGFSTGNVNDDTYSDELFK